MVAAYGKFTLGDLECALDWGRSDFFSVVLGSAANSKSPPHACGPLAARALGVAAEATRKQTINYSGHFLSKLSAAA